MDHLDHFHSNYSRLHQCVNQSGKNEGNDGGIKGRRDLLVLNEMLLRVGLIDLRNPWIFQEDFLHLPMFFSPVSFLLKFQTFVLKYPIMIEQLFPKRIISFFLLHFNSHVLQLLTLKCHCPIVLFLEKVSIEYD